MSLTAGHRLGPYEITGPLGSGGMGEVYKARDTRLDRTVAIKVLPEHVASDPDLKQRFEREAKILATLSHPHICPVFDIGQQNGIDFLVMEFLQGETLESRLASLRVERESPNAEREGAGVGPPRPLRKAGGLPPSQGLEYAIQIADALATAHKHGITHRDLKSGNVMLTKAGSKLLDFGLAKVGGPAVVGVGLSMLPTTLPVDGAQGRPNLTAQGTILGTLQYMAPEQLEGKEADARTDIFAFGALVYEMLTGKKAFEGKSQASLIGAILKDTPPPISEQLSITARKRLGPPQSAEARGSSERSPASVEMLDRVVSTCLAKDPDYRWQTARDLLRELTWVAETASHASASTAVAPAARRASRVAWVAAAIATITTAAAIALGMLYLRSAPAADAPPIRFTVVPPQTVTLSAATGATIPVVSPDGQRLAFVATRGGTNLLWVRSLDALNAQPLPGTENAAFPFWSPDSRALGFFATGTLKIIDAAGGPVRTLCNALSGRGGTWSPDGVIVFGSVSGGLFTVSANGGPPTPLTTPDAAHGESAHRFPSFLPDGRHVLYLATRSNTVLLRSLDSKETTRLLTAESQAVYVAPGSLLFVRQGTLLAQPFDARRATLTGEAVPIVEQVLPADPGGAAAFAASSGGVLAYRTGTLGGPTQLTWVDRAGKPLGPVGQPGRYRNPELSPDGTRVAVDAVDPEGRTQDISLVDLARGVISRFTFDPGNDIYPVWSPDGSRLIFGSDRDGGVFNLYQKRADGVGSDELLLKSKADMAPFSWAPDGRFVVYRAGAGVPFNLGILPLVGERTPRFFEPTRFNETFGQVSPDGRWLAYNSGESGRNEVYVQSFPALGGGKWQISRDGALQPRWRRDGRELFYYAFDGRLMAVPLTSATALDLGAAVPLFEAHLLNGPAPAVGFRQQYDVARDGQRFLLNVPVEQTTASSITVVVNWTAGMKK